MEDTIFLPTELIDAILNYLRLDSASLKACTLVSSSWLASSRRLLFRTVYLTADIKNLDISSGYYMADFTTAEERLDEFNQVLDTNAQIGALIERFQIRKNSVIHRISNDFTVEREALLATLTRLPRLQTLALKSVRICNESGAISTHLRCTSITKLTLSSLSPLPFEIDYIRAIVSYFPNLIDLKVYISFGEKRNQKIQPQETTVDARLQSLTLADCFPLAVWLNLPSASLATVRNLCIWSERFYAREQTTDEELQALGNALSSVAGNLLHLTLSLFTDEQHIPAIAELTAPLTSLETLKCHVGADDNDPTSWNLPPALLARIPSTQLRRVTIGLKGLNGQYGRGPLNPPWTALEDQCMARPSLKVVLFTHAPEDYGPMRLNEHKIRAALPRLAEQKILRVDLSRRAPIKLTGW